MVVPPDVVQRSQARVGTVIGGKWTVNGVLGVGGMATVFAVTHRNKSRAALKLLHPEVTLDASITQRFLREGYVANTVEHPGTVKVIDDDVDEDGAAYLVMELLDGETLEDRRERLGGRLPVSEVVALSAKLLDVMAAAHDQGIVHRDVKPENLFLTKEGVFKVLDFGIARVRELSGQSSGGTMAGTLLGTPAFMSPEQARGRAELVDERSDVWSVGATMFTLLTGHNVHRAETPNEYLIYAATVPARSLAKVAPSLPEALVLLVDKALAFEPTERWQSARQMRDALDGVLALELMDARVTVVPPSVAASHDGETLVSTPMPPIINETTNRPMVVAASSEAIPPAELPTKKRAPWPIVAGVAAVAVGVVALLVFRPGPQPKPSTLGSVTPSAGAAQPTPREPSSPPRPMVDAEPTAPIVAPVTSTEPPAPTKASPKHHAAPLPPKAPPVETKPPVVTKPPVAPPAGTNPFDKRH